MEKPGVIMSETAFKMLLEALTGKTINTPIDGGETSTEIDRFVQGYYEQKKDNPQSNRLAKRDYQVEYEALKDIMFGVGPLQLKFIYEEMNERGHWGCDAKQAGQRLKSVMDRFDGIENVGYGLYQMSDLVLKFNNQDGEDNE